MKQEMSNERLSRVEPRQPLHTFPPAFCGEIANIVIGAASQKQRAIIKEELLAIDGSSRVR